MRLVQGERIAEMRIVGLLGEGATSEVYLVEDTRTGRKRALKLLSVHGRSHRARIRIEGEALSEFRHRNVVGVLRLIDHGGWLGVLMEYVRGPTLHRWLDVETATQEDAEIVIRGVLAGVHALHEHGLVHRDLKPGNVLLEVGPDGVTPRLADFGLVKQLTSESSQTQTGASMGTPAYMAPEQLRDASRVDGRADLYSVGCIYYELLTGSPPFRRDDWWETWKAIEDGERANLDRLPTDTPAWTRALIGRLLEPDPDKRPANVAEVIEAMGGGALEALPMTLGTEGGQRAQRLATELDVRVNGGREAGESSLVSPTTLGEDELMALSPLWSDAPGSPVPAPFLGDLDDTGPRLPRFPVALGAAIVVTLVVLVGLIGYIAVTGRPVGAAITGDPVVVMAPRTPDTTPDALAGIDADGSAGDSDDTDVVEADASATPVVTREPVAPPPGPRDVPPPADVPDGTSEGDPPDVLADVSSGGVEEGSTDRGDGAAGTDIGVEGGENTDAAGTADEPVTGGFAVTGDAAEVVLLGPDGAQYPVGAPVPPGEYRIRVRWSPTQPPVGGGQVSIDAGSVVNLTCKSAFLRCST